jgi:hypothetical protein
VAVAGAGFPGKIAAMRDSIGSKTAWWDLITQDIAD